jgi:AcrR family transcriptional regulator
MTTSSPTYHVPRQKRSRESLERLLDAAQEQIRVGGLESLKITDLVVRAGFSTGAFYARFPNKTALLHAVHKRFHACLEPKIHAELEEQIGEPGDFDEVVRRAFDTLIKHVTGERELSRAFMMMSVFDPVMRAKGQQINLERRDALTRVLITRREEIGHPDPFLAINIAYGMYAGVLRGTLVFGIQHELFEGIKNEVIFDELKQALSLYLRGSKSTPSDD